MSAPPATQSSLNVSIAPTLAEFASAYGETMRWIEYATTDVELGLSERRVLSAICSNPQRAADLVTSLRMDSGQVTKLCSALRDRGLVELQPGAVGNKRIFSATNNGRLLRSKVVARQQQAAAQVWNASSPLQRSRLCTAAGKLTNLLPKQAQQVMLRPIATGDLALMMQDALPHYSEPPYEYDSRDLEFVLHLRTSRFVSAARFERVGFVIEHDSRIPGCILATAQNETTLHIFWHSVAIPYRFKTYGKQLLLAVEQEAARMGYKTILYEYPGNRTSPKWQFLAHMKGWRHLAEDDSVMCGQKGIMDLWKKDLP